MPGPTIATIVFTGICYLVNTKSTGHTDIDKVAVVMPNAQMGLPASGNAVIAPHYAVIKYLKSQADVFPDNRQPDLIFIDKFGNTMGVIRVNGEALSLDGVLPQPLQVATENGAPGGPTCSNGACQVAALPQGFDAGIYDTRFPYEAIVSLKKACPHCTNIDSSPASPLIKPSSTESVIARIDLTGGYLAAGAIKSCKWDFLPKEQSNDSDFNAQELPQMATLDVKTQIANTLTIKSIPFPGMKPKAPLKLQGTKSSPRVVVIIGNAPLSDITAFEDNSMEMTDHHFELYYRIVAPDKPLGHPYPHKSSTQSSDCPKSEAAYRWIHLGNCPPMQQDPMN